MLLLWPRNKAGRRALATVSLLFLALWLAGMTAAISGAGCAKPRIKDERRLRLCNLSLAMPVPPEPQKRARIYLERGIIHARVGDDAQALADFRCAMTDAGPYPFWLAQLDARMEPETGAAAQIWAGIRRR
ncbi:MAG: hypothetical protein Q4G49_13585 [Paracoccus sp. (in: a-proteobacteria)]|nr:hypothetical protein [Paracoccus sp. (in: a-proteobacteria)]